MAATTIASIVTQVRRQLVEATARFWSDDELKDIMKLGAIDLWGAILDLHQDHYFKVAPIGGDGPVLRANDDHISNVPEDCFRVMLIEPADTSSMASGHQVLFVYRKYKHSDFSVARTLSAQDPSALASRTIYYDVTGVGAPNQPPVILTAPFISTDLRLRIAYNPMVVWEDVNPIPGGSDNALKAWTIAYARAKENESRQPDPGWLGVYATEKQTVLTRLTPRDEQEPEVAEDIFQGFGSIW
jgi:hypothetical protein